MTQNRAGPAPAPAYGRFKARFKPSNKIVLLHKKRQLTLRDVSEAGFRIAATGFDEAQIYKFDIVFTDENEVCGWRVRAQCMWTTQEEAGFKFLLGHFERTLSSRIARMHLRGAIPVLDGTGF